VRLVHRVGHAESIPEDLQEIFGVKAVSQIGNETYVLLRGAAQIQDGEAGLIPDIGEEFFQAAAGARVWIGIIGRTSRSAQGAAITGRRYSVSRLTGPPRSAK